jgi:hypothetical protein
MQVRPWIPAKSKANETRCVHFRLPSTCPCSRRIVSQAQWSMSQWLYPAQFTAAQHLPLPPCSRYLLFNPLLPAHPIMFSAQTSAFPSKPSDTIPPPMTTQKPLDTPPSSTRTSSSEMLPPPEPLPSGPPSNLNKRGSVIFPSDNPTLPPTDDAPARPRYHSTVSQPATATLSRSQSSSNFAGKLKSLRKKIENELSRKRTGGNAPQRADKRGTKKPQKGTVAGLRPSPALTVPESMSVADASQLCAAKRTDCVLVVDDEEGLSGIFTAKDLAFRVSACKALLTPGHRRRP